MGELMTEDKELTPEKKIVVKSLMELEQATEPMRSRLMSDYIGKYPPEIIEAIRNGLTVIRSSEIIAKPDKRNHRGEN